MNKEPLQACSFKEVLYLQSQMHIAYYVTHLSLIEAQLIPLFNHYSATDCTHDLTHVKRNIFNIERGKKPTQTNFNVRSCRARQSSGRVADLRADEANSWLGCKCPFYGSVPLDTDWWCSLSLSLSLSLSPHLKRGEQTGRGPAPNPAFTFLVILPLKR